MCTLIEGVMGPCDFRDMKEFSRRKDGAVEVLEREELYGKHDFV